MSLKTEYSYNEDDFAERGGNMEELTVTITLCEYRNLITETTRGEINLNAAHEKIAELERKNAELANALAACKLPEWCKQIGRMLCGEDDEEESEEADNGTTDTMDG